jgi:tetratricopeptide repeat protein/photosynthetic reaction center cytochrome c subunit
MNIRSFAVTTSTLLLLSSSGPAPAVAQGSWAWPEKGKNLKVLPADMPPDRLRAVMMGFTRSLGVRCTHCHVGEEGKPLSTYDFPSDAKQKKEVARGMLRMLGTINEQLREIQPEKEDRVNMWCHTCHRGRPRPMSLAEELGKVYAKSGADSTIAHYRSLREEFYGAGSYDFREPALNEIGYKALGGKDVPGAIAVFKLNAQNFPESANVYDSLGEAYLAAGDTAQAISQYQKSLQIEPKNQNAAKTLEKLGVGGKPGR